MGKRGQGRPVHGRTGGRGNGRAGKRGRKQLSGMPDGGLSMIDCLIDTLPGDRPRSRRGRGNGGGGGGGGRDGRPRNTGNGARTSGGRPRDTTKRQGGGGTRPGLANGDRHDAALADYAANIMGASSSDSENEDDADGAFSILAGIEKEKAQKTKTAASKRRRVLAGVFAAGLDDLEEIEFGRVTIDGATASSDAEADSDAVEETREVVGAEFATRFFAAGQTPDHDPADNATADTDADVTGARRTPDNAATRSKGRSAGSTGAVSRMPGSLSFERVYGAVTKFLASADAKLRFPALDRLDRWKVYQVANLFRLASSSVGKGKKRKSIMLIRPVAPLEPHGPSGDEVEQARRAFRDALVTAEFPELPPASRPTVSVDGLVGGDAASIGPANRGFGMLAKMGWRPGESLGLRKGRIDPVMAVKRPRRRSGLGE